MSEYAQFVGAMVLFGAVLVGSYRFVLLSSGERLRAERGREAG